MRRILPLIALTTLLTLCTLRMSAQTETKAPPSENDRSGLRTNSDADIKEDFQKMRVILNQMRTNLAFVGNTTTPLAHQFQLEIDMWQALLDRMEKSEGAAEPEKQSPK